MKRRQSKYSRVDNSTAARKAYSRHDGEAEPDDVCDDVSPEILAEIKEGFYQTKVIISELEAKAIEEATRDQVEVINGEMRGGNSYFKNEEDYPQIKNC